jgi:branched-chain amino acid aminotransferase
MGLFEAFDRGGDTVVLSDGKGNVTEGPGFNVFAVVGGRLITPADGVLDGITRKTVFELCTETNLAASAEPLPADVVRTADEVFLSTTAGGIIPVTTVDGKKIGDGRPGPVTWRLRGLYWQKRESGWHGTLVDYSVAPQGA